MGKNNCYNCNFNRFLSINYFQDQSKLLCEGTNYDVGRLATPVIWSQDELQLLFHFIWTPVAQIVASFVFNVANTALDSSCLERKASP